MRWRWYEHGLRFGAIALVATGCRQLTGLDEFEEERARTKDAATEATCSAVGYPAPPEGADDGTQIEFIVAQRTTPAEQWGNVAAVGFNLDRRCTGLGDGPSCIPSPGDPALQIDGPGGTDNAGARFLSTLNFLSPLTRLAVDEENAGSLVALYRVRGYNGLPDDPIVHVDVFGGTLRTAAGPPVTPLWNGDDAFRLLTNWLVAETTDGGQKRYSSERPLYRSERAYVANGQLVARFAKLLAGGPMMAYGVELSATLAGDGGRWKLTQGTLAARMDLVETLPDLLLVASNCRPPFDASTAATFRALFCPYVDLRTQGEDPTLPCNALSWASRFTAVPARIEEGEYRELPARCDDSVRREPIVCGAPP
jgi:hypothetical protein